MADKKTPTAIDNGEKPQKVTAVVPKFQLTHKIWDRALAAALTAVAFKFGDPKAVLKQVIQFVVNLLKGVKNNYDWQKHHAVYDWKKTPMSKYVAVTTLVAGWYFLVKAYVIEKKVVKQAHKKYKAHNNTLAVALHGTGSALEITMGCAACCYPERAILTQISSALAINNILTGFVLTPGVFGIKHLTVPGFYLFGVLRLLEILRTLVYDYRNYPQAWILLQVGTVVRLLGFWVLPYSSTDGRRGDLFTEPSIYSFNILLSGYLTAAFVYPPKWLLVSLLCYIHHYNKQPPKISTKRRLGYEAIDDSPAIVEIEKQIGYNSNGAPVRMTSSSSYDRFPTTQ